MWRMLRRVARVLAWVTLSLVLLALVAATTLILWARSPPGRRVLSSMIVSRLQRQLGLSASIGALDGDLTRTCVLRDVRLYDREQRIAAAFPQIRLEYDLLGLFRRTLRIRAIDIDGRVQARLLGSGQLNLTPMSRPLRAALARSSESLGRWIIDVRAAHARVAFAAHGSGQVRLRGELTLDATANLAAHDYDVEIPRLDVAIDEPIPASLAASGAAQWTSGLPSFRDLHIEIQTEGGPLPFLASEPTLGPLTMTTRAHGRAGTLLVTTSRGELRIEAAAENEHDGHVGWVAKAHASNLDPQSILIQAPHGRMELAAHASGKGNAAAIVVDTLRIEVADTRAWASGRADVGHGVRMDVRGELRSPDLSRIGAAIGARLGGAVLADLHLRKTTTDSAVDATLHAHDLRVGDGHAQLLDARVHAANRAGSAALNVRRAQLSIPHTAGAVARLRSVALRLDGDGRSFVIVGDAVAEGSAHLRLRARGVALPHANEYTAAIELRELVLGGTHERWKLTEPARVRLGRNGVAAKLSMAGGARALVVDGSLERAPARIHLDVHGRHLDVTALARALSPELNLPATELSIDARAEGTPAAPRLGLRLAATSGDARLRARFDTSPQSRGIRSLDGDLTVSRLQLVHLRPLLPHSLRGMSGRASLTVELEGTTAAPTLTAHVTLRPWHIADEPPYATSIDVAYKRARLAVQLDSRSLHADGGVISLQAELPIELTLEPRGPRLRVAAASPLTLTFRGHDLALSRLPLRSLGLGEAVRGGTLEASIDGSGTFAAPVAEAHVEVRDLAATNADHVFFTLDGALRRQHAGASLRATRHGAVLLAARAESTLDLSRLVNARARRDTPLSLRATVSAEDLSALPGLAGAFDARAELAGTLAHPRFSGVLHARDLAAHGMELSDADAEASWNGEALDALVQAHQPSGGSLRVVGRIPRRPEQPLDARVELHGLKLALDRVGQLRRLEGTLDTDLRLTGTRIAPSADGFVELAHGSVAFGSAHRVYHDVTLDLALRNHTLELRRFAVAADGGALTAHGRLSLEGLLPSAVDLVAEADHFPFQPRDGGTWVDARLEMHAERLGERVAGKITVSDGHARIEELAPAAELQPTGALEDVVFVDETPRQPSSLARRMKRQAQALDVTILAKIPGPFRIESPELRAELRGELELRAVGGTIGLYGRAETSSGRFELLNRPYELERARVIFDGDFDPIVDVRLTRDVRNAKVIIAVHGTAKKPELELTSDPPIYGESQLIGIVLAGDPESQHIAAPSTSEQLVGAISGVLVGRILEQIVPALPIDVIRLDTRAGPNNLGSFENARLEIGKYLRENLYVSYVHRFGTTVRDVHRNNTHEANVELRFRRRFVLSMRYGDAGIGAFGLSWTLRF